MAGPGDPRRPGTDLSRPIAPEDAPRALRDHRRRRRVEEWALVLASQGLRSRVVSASGRFVLEVADEDHARADALLETWERENPPAPPPEAPPEFFWPAGFAVFTALLGFFAVTGPRDSRVAWFADGSAQAAQILAGEWWRATTALTLHADLGHILGNTLTGVIVVSAVCGAVGPGLGLAWVLAAGTVGNLVNAAASAPGSTSVGASTAIFGAVGLLAALAVRRKLRGGLAGRRLVAPLAAGLGILAMLGTSEGSDFSGHLFGLLAGAVVGGLWAPAPTRIASPALQWGFGCAAVGWVLACWSFALGL